MRNQYAWLNSTPYLYSSQALRGLYSDARSKEEKRAIQRHIERHNADSPIYPGYFDLCEDIEEELEVRVLDWEELQEEFEIVKRGSKIEFRRRRDD
ncbi:hypothetical protein [Ectobacillus ponti]|uniref:Uncharacterized protein n=1 Tax=Ectobacillus ponti TaxID=2961894 RepID=A0AA42BSI7_9BACI|nr:hypothetical protein [Ectobacillus ponti]MCP8970584.1 hypothetical protein [Ectobacillus ponti]